MEMIHTWGHLKVLAFALDLPHVELAASWDNEILKAHGKLWTWWSPHVDAAIFIGSIGDRDALIADDPDTFLTHPRYAKLGNILVAAGRLDPEWAKTQLRASWRSMAPRRELKAFDLTQRALTHP